MTSPSRNTAGAAPAGFRFLWLLALAAVAGMAASPPLHAQKIQLFAHANAELHTLGDSRMLLRDALEAYREQNLPVRRTSWFPAFPGGSIGVRLGEPQGFQWLFEIGRSSTGARLHYSDYSGEIRDDMVMSRVFAGAGIVTPTRAAMPVRGIARMRYSRSAMHSDSYYRLGDETGGGASTLRAGGMSLSVAGTVERQVGPVNVHLLVGGEYALDVTILPFWIRHAFRAGGHSLPVSASWTGVHAGVGIAYSL